MVYHGNCHCGGYRFELQVRDQTKLGVRCDCILCKKQGYIWFIAEECSLKIVRDDGNLIQYRSSAFKHEFCSICGTGVLGEHFEGPLKGRVVVNVRTLRGVDPFEFEVIGERSAFTVEKGSPIPSTGSCLCGLVRAELLKPIEEMQIKEDNCSICARNAWIGVYPSKSLVKLSGSEHARDYQFGRRFMGHPFCGSCGVHVYMNVYGPPQDIIDRLPSEKRDLIQKKLDLAPVNVRVLDNIDLRVLKIERKSEGTDGYEQNVLCLT